MLRGACPRCQVRCPLMRRVRPAFRPLMTGSGHWNSRRSSSVTAWTGQDGATFALGACGDQPPRSLRWSRPGQIPADGRSGVQLLAADGACTVCLLAGTIRICRRRRAPSFPARGVETHDDLDDRALPDRLRSLHRHLDGH